MPSITLRRRKYWIQFYLPGSRAPIRQSLGVEDHAAAQLMSDKQGNLLALLDPRLADVQLPPDLLARLPATIARPSLPDEDAGADSCVVAPVPEQSKGRPALVDVIRGYFSHIEESNQKRWVSVKVKVLRVLFGDHLVTKATNLTFPRVAPESGLFRGKTLEDISSKLLAELVAARKARDGVTPAAKKTKRHYREVLHDFFEYCLSHSLMEVRNFHTPNPVAPLPSYLDTNHDIRFLNDEQIDGQMAAVAHYASLNAGAMIMIEAGLRRCEALWLDRDAISPDLRVLSIRTRYDPETDRESSLKTRRSKRAVTISPKLRNFLGMYLPTLEGRWLIPSPRGKQWNSDNFSSALSAANRKAELPWTSADYRHTFSTRRAFLDRWSSIRLAREMGTSVTMIDGYYAGFLHPD